MPAARAAAGEGSGERAAAGGARPRQELRPRPRAARADFTVYPGEVVALIGDNGAGKSTLVKTLSGVHARTRRDPLRGPAGLDPGPSAARELGIETVYQDLALAPDLDPRRTCSSAASWSAPGLLGRLGFLDKARDARRTERRSQLGVGVQDATAPVATFSGGQRQGVAVARAVTWASKVVFMDEPTAALGVVQTRACST